MDWINNNMKEISAVIVAVLTLVGIIVTYFKNKSKKEQPPTPIITTTVAPVTTVTQTPTTTVAPTINIYSNGEKSNQDIPITTHEQGIKIETKSSEKKSTKRYLRRRCRYIPDGSQEFKKIITELITLKIVDRINGYDEKIRKLKDATFEQKIANAVYNENIGNIDNMVDILNSIKLTGKKESVRLLFLGIAYEKLDNTESAIKCYNKILKDENNTKLRKSAQFNILLCEEKDEDTNVDFTKFFNDKTVLLGKQRIKDKALTMHLIVCQKNDKPFTYDDILQESLQYELEHNPTGYVKTQLSYNDLKKSSLTPQEIADLQAIASEKSINARVAILVNLHNKISDTQSLEAIRNTLNALKDKYKDYTIEKHIEELN